MYIYNGKLNWFTYAENECVTFVFPGGFAINDPVSAFWQWTTDAQGNQKSNTSQNGVIDSVSKPLNGEFGIGISFGYYRFDGTIADDFSTVKVTMQNARGESDPNGASTLELQYKDPVSVPSTVVYTGKLHWFDYADNEMVTLVVPAGVESNAPVGLYFQWTEAGDGSKKINLHLNSTFHNVVTDQNGESVASFTDEYYTFDVTINPSKLEFRLGMINPSGERDSHAPYQLEQTDFRSTKTRKALIAHFGTGTDTGIFDVRDMLTKYLAFSQDDIEMLYYDTEVKGGPNECLSGQKPPTAANFKDRFTSLLSSASRGSVCFIYVDVHGTTYPDEEHSGEPDDKDEGWFFAETDDGITKVIISDDWVSQAINENLGADVNLTILTSSCMGGGMLDTHTTTRGILLAGCHESQFNVKVPGLQRRDPWMNAIVNVIKSRVKRKRGVPSYTILFNEAKQFIKRQIVNGDISTSGEYKGPSPDELNPIPWDQAAFTSNQDPQLIFYSGYLDPDVERFLYPFAEADAGEASGDVTRFPKDEL